MIPLLTGHGLSRFEPAVKAALKPSFLLLKNDRGTASENHLGGVPELSAEQKWPESADGPLGFVAQLDLATLPALPGLNLPAAGLLSFFYDGEVWGFSPEHKTGFRVLYSPDRGACVPRPFPENLGEELRFTCVGLSAGPAVGSLPDVEDPVVQAWGLDDEDCNHYYEFKEEWLRALPEFRHRVGGYPDVIQGDPKLEAQLASRGLDCGDPSGYSKGAERGWDVGAGEWELLLQVDSEEAAGMVWGDMGRLYFLIHRDDLRQRKFEKVWMVLQCS
jgi:uncharacterized protein YwqG